jgi:hypothetical protein
MDRFATTFCNMNITFGLSLDQETQVKPASLAESRVGPLGMLTLLESRLGLASPGASQIQRLTAALSAMEEVYQEDDAYGKASFERDRFAVTQLFLNYRDELMLAGWDGLTQLNGSSRLSAISQFSSRLNAEARCSLGDRLLAIQVCLKDRRFEWASLKVMGEKEDFGLAWQNVLELLGAVYEPDTFDSHASTGKSDSDLQRFRQAVTSGAAKIDLQYDGTLEILTAHSEWILAQAVQLLSSQEKSVLVVGGDHTAALDAAYARANCPTVGISTATRARPVPQVLGLALRLLWQPLDPQFLLEFLTHPECPVTSDLCKQLAKALLESPGIGGRAWQEAIAKAKERVNTMAKNKTEADQRLARIDHDLTTWIEIQRHNLNGAAPAAALKAICQEIQAWAIRQLSRFDESDPPQAAQFRFLIAAAKQMSQGLDAIKNVTLPEMNRLLETVLGSGIDSGLAISELGHVGYAHSPEQVNSSASIVLWWNAEESAETRLTHWTETERASLSQSGVVLSPREHILARAARSWLKPLHAAQEKLLLCLPQQRAGKPVVQHPLIGRLSSLLKERARLPMRNLDEALPATSAAEQKNLRDLDPVLLPQKRRWWQLPAGISVPLREQESFTSLEKFIYAPQLWVLEYAAKIRPGHLNTEQLDCGPRLYGTLIDRLAEELFGTNPPDHIDWSKATADQLESWARQRWETLLEREGMPLLVVGRQSERVRVLSEAIVAIQDLVTLFKQMKIADVKPHEKPEAVAFAGGKLTGNIDLMLTNTEGDFGILDLKYGGRADKERQLKEGRPLQLAVYGHLVSGGKLLFPFGAFYILSSRRLLSCNASFFTAASPVAAEAGSSDLQKVWQEFEQIWRWRRGQLDNGLIEVVSDDTTPDQNSIPPLANWESPKEADKYSDHTTLTGF